LWCISSFFMIQFLLLKLTYHSYRNRLFNRITQTLSCLISIVSNPSSYQIHWLSILVFHRLPMINDVKDKKKVLYLSLIRLPTLKYCKLSIKGNTRLQFPSVKISKLSPIEHLIIDHIREFHSILSYTPHIHRLSIDCLHGSVNKQVKLHSIVWNHLTHVSLDYDEFQSFVKKICVIKFKFYIFQQMQIEHI
jgi:hypothetical protein